MHRSSQLYKYLHISYSNKFQFSSVSIQKLPDFSSSDCIDSQEALHQHLRAQFSSSVYKHTKLLLQLQGSGQVAPLEFKSLGQPRDSRIAQYRTSWNIELLEIQNTWITDMRITTVSDIPSDTDSGPT